jgi:hypothetical protein
MAPRVVFARLLLARQLTTSFRGHRAEFVPRRNLRNTLPLLMAFPLETAGGQAMSNMTTVEAKAFVPATDFALSKQFYQDLGFEIAWSSDDLAYLRHGNASFLLQNFKEPPDWTWKLGGAMSRRWAWPPSMGSNSSRRPDRPWGIRDFVVVDPTYVLCRIGQNIGRPFDTIG